MPRTIVFRYLTPTYVTVDLDRGEVTERRVAHSEAGPPTAVRGDEEYGENEHRRARQIAAKAQVKLCEEEDCT